VFNTSIEVNTGADEIDVLGDVGRQGVGWASDAGDAGWDVGVFVLFLESEFIRRAHPMSDKNK